MSQVSRGILLAMGLVALLLIGVGADSHDDLTPETRERLSERLREWDLLPAETQERLRQIHVTIQDSSANSSNRAAYERYRRWVDVLPPTDSARLREANLDDDRLAIVREVLERQSAQFDHELGPLREERASGLRRPGRWNGRLMREHFNLIATLRNELSQAELQRLDTLRFSDKLPLVLALAKKHGVDIPGELAAIEPGVFELFFRLVEDPIQHFGGDSYQRISDDAKKRFAEFVTDIWLLPELDAKQQFELIREQPEPIRRGLQKLGAQNATAYKLLVSVLYYQQHKDKAPAESRDSLDLLDPRKILMRATSPPGGRRPPPRFGPPPGPGDPAPP